MESLAEKTTNYSIEQFEQDLSTAAFSTVKPIPHNNRLSFYGGMGAVDELYRATSRNVAIQHRKAKALHPLNEQEATREVDQELRDPSRCSLQGFFSQVVKHGGSIPQEVRQRLLSVTGDSSLLKKQPKPGIDELFEIELEKARTTYDLNYMSGADTDEDWAKNRWEVLNSKHQESLRIAEYVNPLTKKRGGDALPKHEYIARKGLTKALDAFEVSSAFVDPYSQNLIVPFVSPWGLENRWRDAQGNTVAMSDNHLVIHNCASYQKIPSSSGPKTFCSGTKTKGLFHPIGRVQDASTVVLLEGYATGLTGYQSSKVPTVCVGSCDNFLAVVAALWESDTCGRMLLIGDSGTEDKLKKAHKAISLFSPELGRNVAWATVPGPDNYDLNDLMIDSGLEAVKTFIDDKIEKFHKLNKPDPAKAFIRSASDILADESCTDFIVDGIIARASLGTVVGETGAGKSFYGIDLACCNATGTAFHGRKVKQTNALYVVGEGARGYRTRIKAWMALHGLQEPPDGLSLTAGAVDLSDAEKLAEISKFCEEKEIGIIFFDTFHRCFSGEENSARDVGGALQNIGKHFTEKDIAVVLVHHSGHAAAGRGRGSSSLKAGVDWELLIEKCEDGLKVTPTKIKDGELFLPETFRLVKQDTGWVDDKGAVSSLVLEKGDAKKLVRLNRKDAQLWAALKSLGTNFTRDAAERTTFGMIEAKNKGQYLSRFLTKMSNNDQLKYQDDNYLFLN